MAARYPISLAEDIWKIRTLEYEDRPCFNHEYVFPFTLAIRQFRFNSATKQFYGPTYPNQLSPLFCRDKNGKFDTIFRIFYFYRGFRPGEYALCPL